MGMFRHNVQVFDPSGQAVATVEAWVDTGSTYSWLPKTVFEQAGVQPSEEREFILADGSRERRNVAQMRVSLGGPPFFTYCAVAEAGEESLQGAVALEEAGLAVDTVNRRLVPTASYALTAR
jgi:clan AA aspartic protease